MKSKNAIVLLNMGGPSNLDEIEIFLKNMFLDPLILRIPFKFVRAFIANKIIKSRLEYSKDNYRKIGGKSPLLDHTKALAKKIEKSSGIKCEIVMRYVEPFADGVIENLRKSGVKEVVLFPLYPQFSTTTTLSSFRNFEALAKDFKIKKINNFYKNSRFNELIIKKIKEQLNGKNPKEFSLILSAHGIPESVVKAGDPYEKECNEHREIVLDLIRSDGLEFKSVELVYQSRFGRAKWLEPYLADKLKELREKDIKKVIIYPISFAIDNLETDYELMIEYREIAMELGYEEYLVAKCPNSSDEFVEVILEEVGKAEGRR